MRSLLAIFNPETITLLPVPTPFEGFFSGSPDVVCGDHCVNLGLFNHERDRYLRHRYRVEAL